MVALPQRSHAIHSDRETVVGFGLSAFDATEEAELVEAVAVEPAQELEIVGPINGEVPASLYADWDQAER